MKSSKEVVRLGIDLGKNVFHLIGVNEPEGVVWKKKLRRSQATLVGNQQAGRPLHPHPVDPWGAGGGANRRA